MNHEFYLPTEVSTQQLSARLAACLHVPLVMAFSGEIGVGKTTFIRFLLQALGIQGAIKSPTFSIVESYQMAYGPLHHFDLYRILDPLELEYIGFRDYFTASAVCCIEWPERAPDEIGTIDLWFNFNFAKEGRMVAISASTLPGKSTLACLLKGDK